MTNTLDTGATGAYSERVIAVESVESLERETDTGQVVAVAERWREHRGLSHSAFARAMGREPADWAHMRSGRRGAPPAFVRALRRDIREREPGTHWLTLLDEAILADAVERIEQGES